MKVLRPTDCRVKFERGDPVGLASRVPTEPASQARQRSRVPFTALSAIPALPALLGRKHHLADGFVWVAVTHCD
jgi:hypothetical protein